MINIEHLIFDNTNSLQACPLCDAPIDVDDVDGEPRVCVAYGHVYIAHAYCIGEEMTDDD